MSERTMHPKLTASRLQRRAIVYLRQSTDRQVVRNKESQSLQYGLVDYAEQLGFSRVQRIDDDLGYSAAVGAQQRVGFERLLAQVALGDVGLVLSREVSRLSRTDRDWCRLLELCQLFDTMVGDCEQLYDLSLMDDQLVLGIKGTLSVVELRVLRQRLYEGMQNKARRGELFRTTSPGYVVDGTGKLVKDPDRRVQDGIALVFRKFRHVGSARQTFQWFVDHGVELPVNKSQGGRLSIVFQRPTLTFVTEMLRNPVYAGAYVYGRRPMQSVVVDGQIRRRQASAVPPEQARVFLRDHHEGYIDYEAYQENQRMLKNNCTKFERNELGGPARAGKGLLTGLLRCARCGRKLHVRYRGKGGTSPRYLCKGDYEQGGQYCLGFGGTVDARFAEQVLAVLSPLGIEASLKALQDCERGHNDQRQALQRQIEQAQYEALRAQEQYDEVDPRHRLVAAQLEQRWNDKLSQLQALKARLVEQAVPPTLSTPQRKRLMEMGEDFTEVWHSPHCSPELKKKIIRTVVEEVVVDEVPLKTLRFVIHWKGGVHTEFSVPKPHASQVSKTCAQDLEIITKMAVRYGDDQICSVLNRLGRRTGKGNRYTEQRIAATRKKYAIKGQRTTAPDPNVCSQQAAARYLKVSDTTVKRFVDAKLLRCTQIVPGAPWEIVRDDLEHPQLKAIVERLHATGKLVLKEGRSDKQKSLFQ